MRASPPHHRSFYFCSFSLCESTAKIPLGLALRRAGVRFIPGNRYPGMWSASIQCRVGMNATLVGKTLKKIDSKIGAANRELKAGAADDERAQLLANEGAGLVALAAQYGAVYVTDFASGGGALERSAAAGFMVGGSGIARRWWDRGPSQPTSQSRRRWVR